MLSILITKQTKNTVAELALMKTFAADSKGGPRATV